MPTYRNDNDHARFVLEVPSVPDSGSGVKKQILPGETVETYEDLSTDGFTKTLDSPYSVREISAQNLWTDAVLASGRINISISGSGWAATVTLQRSSDGGVTWRDVENWAVNAETYLVGEVLYRLGVKTGNYTSGTITVELY